MIKIENVTTYGFKEAIRGMRNPMNSWDKSDSDFFDYPLFFNIGGEDGKLMASLASSGTSHSKYRRMIVVYADIVAPLYWWKEFDTYKVGTVANSCSTMHKIHAKEFTLDDFSFDHMNDVVPLPSTQTLLKSTLDILNSVRELYLVTKDKGYWWQMIQLLPSSYNQRRTVMLNYEVLAAIYEQRKNHKLDEWRYFCDWIKTLPYSSLITREVI
jgi:hypothetical protein